MIKNIYKRSLALLLVLVLCTSLRVPSAAQASVSVPLASASEYIYNTGTRGTVATALSENALAFYRENGTSYAALTAHAGGTGVSDAPSSALYNALQTLMRDAQHTVTSYNGTKSLFQYTDCEGGGGRISSFYSGTPIGPSWDGGWNREHTWPESKGLGGNDENDIMMLRPTASNENGARGNTAYGESSGYYNPNTASGGKYDLRGDVARIFLYVYVRWGNVNGNGTYTAWGKRGVMESVEVMLAWIKEDPVDTWELGRNDAVESITGTRNVFVDYPALAFLLFGEEIPDGMITPSGESATRCDHDNFDAGTTVAATCTKEGYTLYTCLTAGCGYSYKTNVTKKAEHSYRAAVTAPTCTKAGFTTYTCTQCPYSYVGSTVAAKGHRYVSGVCSACNATEGIAEKVTVSFKDVANRTDFSAFRQIWEQNGIKVTNNKASSQSNVADYKDPVRFYKGSDVRIDYPGITKLEIDCNGLDTKYTEGWLNAPTGATATKSGGTVTVIFDAPTDSVTYTNLSAQCRAYSITVYAEAAQAPACTHQNTAIEGAIDSTCTENGHTGSTRCLDCDTVIDAGQAIPALGHDWIDATSEAPKTCRRCGTTEGDKLPDTSEPSTGNAPDAPDTPAKDHSGCSAGILKTILNTIVNFFRVLFGGRPKCVCGEYLSA